MMEVIGLDTIDIDPSTPLGQVRLNIGDVNGEIISDSTLNGFLLLFEDDVYKSTVAALRALKSHFAKRVRCESGDVERYEHQLYEHYCDLLEAFTTDPALGGSNALFRFTGVNTERILARERDDNLELGPIRNKWLQKQDFRCREDVHERSQITVEGFLFRD